MNKCLFCSIVKNNEPFHEIIWEDRTRLAFLDIHPVNDGHTLLVPKKHSEYIFDLSEKEYSDLLKSARKIAVALKRVLRCERIALVVEGFSVSHTHIHLIPLYKRHELGLFKNKKRTRAQLGKMGKMLREKFRNNYAV